MRTTNFVFGPRSNSACKEPKIMFHSIQTVTRHVFDRMPPIQTVIRHDGRHLACAWRPCSRALPPWLPPPPCLVLSLSHCGEAPESPPCPPPLPSACPWSPPPLLPFHSLSPCPLPVPHHHGHPARVVGCCCMLSMCSPLEQATATPRLLCFGHDSTPPPLVVCP